jgi:TonB family protein
MKLALTFAVMLLVGTSISPQQSQTSAERLRQMGVTILSDTQGVDFNEYVSDMLQPIRSNWYAKMPEEAKQPKMLKGKVSVRFAILKSGALDEAPTVEVSSGNKVLDDAAVAAVRAATPFERLPESLRRPKTELRLTFLYNLPLSALNP